MVLYNTRTASVVRSLMATAMIYCVAIVMLGIIVNSRNHLPRANTLSRDSYVDFIKKYTAFVKLSDLCHANNSCEDQSDRYDRGTWNNVGTIHAERIKPR